MNLVRIYQVYSIKTVVSNKINKTGLKSTGLSYVNTQLMWAVRNDPPTLFKLVFSGKYWLSSTSNGWGKGKSLVFPTGIGSPDSEDVTLDDKGVLYIVSERDQFSSSTSRLSVLQYLDSGSASTLAASKEWDLTSQFPKVDPNKGLEGITWISDSFLTAQGFYDSLAGTAYNPAKYANHGNGLFFIGLEADGHVYAYALDFSNTKTFHQIASFSSGESTIMSVQFDTITGITVTNTLYNQSTLTLLPITIDPTTNHH